MQHEPRNCSWMEVALEFTIPLSWRIKGVERTKHETESLTVFRQRNVSCELSISGRWRGAVCVQVIWGSWILRLLTALTIAGETAELSISRQTTVLRVRIPYSWHRQKLTIRKCLSQLWLCKECGTGSSWKRSISEIDWAWKQCGLSGTKSVIVLLYRMEHYQRTAFRWKSVDSTRLYGLQIR